MYSRPDQTPDMDSYQTPWVHIHAIANLETEIMQARPHGLGVERITCSLTSINDEVISSILIVGIQYAQTCLFCLFHLVLKLSNSCQAPPSGPNQCPKLILMISVRRVHTCAGHGRSRATLETPRGQTNRRLELGQLNKTS